jgi:hypothetical protein
MEKPLNLKEDPDDGDVENGKEEDKPDGTITAASNAKDDCSDLTDNINDADEQAPKSFPQRVSRQQLSKVKFIIFVSGKILKDNKKSDVVSATLY